MHVSQCMWSFSSFLQVKFVTPSQCSLKVHLIFTAIKGHFLVWQWAPLVCPVGSLVPGQQGLYRFISVCPMHSRAPAPEQEVNKWLLTDVESATKYLGFGCLDHWGEKELGAGKDLWLWSRNKRGTYWKLPQEGKLFFKGENYITININGLKKIKCASGRRVPNSWPSFLPKGKRILPMRRLKPEVAILHIIKWLSGEGG